RVAGHRDELHRRGGQRRGPNVVDRAHHRRDRAGVEHLLWAMHGEELAKTGVPSEAIYELEPGRRLGIGHMQVGDVHDACDRLTAPRNTTAMTVPTNGPSSISPSVTRDTASGLTSAIAGPSGTSG